MSGCAWVAFFAEPGNSVRQLAHFFLFESKTATSITVRGSFIFAKVCFIQTASPLSAFLHMPKQFRS